MHLNTSFIYFFTILNCHNLQIEIFAFYIVTAFKFIIEMINYDFR